MKTKFSWILLAFILCSLVSWGSTFTPGVGPAGKRQMAPRPSNKQEDFITAFCEHVRPCKENYRRESLQRDARPAKYEKF
ncbi:hypothetical protein ACROYT_G011165 [Oculina patagonica]